MAHHSVDIQWGNHDILWMGAAAGSKACIANILNFTAKYNNLDSIEGGYGINLRPLSAFAMEAYKDDDCGLFSPVLPKGEGSYNPKDVQLVAKMHKAIVIMQFKLEGQIILRHPEFEMQTRLLLDKINLESGTVTVDGKEYPLKDTHFPTLNPQDPYALTPDEEEVIGKLQTSFMQSEKLQKHVRFLFANGSVYKCYNLNLLYHGCVPMEENGEFTVFEAEGVRYSGKALMDYCDFIARQAYFSPRKSPARQRGLAFIWYLWCGAKSPMFGKEKMTTFERYFIDCDECKKEPKNHYYQHENHPDMIMKILSEFGLDPKESHIINGHVPVKFKKGESPIKADGKLIVIDGGFCKAYQSETGSAGYTLIYNSHGLRLTSHEPFESQEKAVKENKDILSHSAILETASSRILVSDTDAGKNIKEKIHDLKMLLAAYRLGIIKENK